MESTKDLPKYKLKKIDIDFIDLIADDKVKEIHTVLSQIGSVKEETPDTQTIITVNPKELLSRIPKSFLSGNNDYLIKIIKNIEFSIFKNSKTLNLNIITLRVSLDESCDITKYKNDITNFSTGVSAFIYSLGGFSNRLYKNTRTCPFLIKSYFVTDESTLNRLSESAFNFNKAQNKESDIYNAVLSLEPPQLYSNNDALCSYVLEIRDEIWIIRTLFANSGSEINQLYVTNIVDKENLIHEDSVVSTFQKEFLLDQILLGDGFISFLILLKIWSGYINNEISDITLDIDKFGLNAKNLKKLDYTQKRLYWLYAKNIFIANRYNPFLNSLSSGKGIFTEEIKINNPKFNYLDTSVKEVYKSDAPLLATLSKIITQDIKIAMENLNNLKEFVNSLKNTVSIEENRRLTSGILALTAIIAISSVVTAIFYIAPNNLGKSSFSVLGFIVTYGTIVRVGAGLIVTVAVLAFISWKKFI